MKSNVTYEEALRRATPGLAKKIEHSVGLVRRAERLALMYDAEGGFWNTFSGGKDSQALYHIMEMSGVRFHTVFSPTTVDPPKVIRFIREHYPEVEFGKVRKSMYDLSVEEGILPSMTVRYCCAKYKEMSGAGKVTTIGIRKSESTRRGKRNEIEITGRKFSGTEADFETYREQIANDPKKRKYRSAEGDVMCIHGKESLLVSPIIEWTDGDVWEFLNEVVRVPHCELYDEGRTRIGCVLCPMSSYKNKMRDIAEYPHAKHRWIKAIMDIRRGGVLNSTTTSGGAKQQNSQLRELGGKRYGEFLKSGDSKADLEKVKINIMTKNAGYKQNALDIKDNEQAKRELRLVGGGQKMSKDDPYPYPKETVESYGGEYTQEEIDIAEVIFSWWISGKGYTKWYADTIQQQKLEFE